MNAAVIAPHTNWRGQFSGGTYLQGSQSTAPVSWPGYSTTAWYQGKPPQEQNRVYMGTVLEGQRDASGQMYMRNRMYDPQTGQFTQTDPIGIAGGLNTYGFAAGDPVSYSDPYGLCKHRRGIARILNLADAPCATRDEAARRALTGVRERPAIQRREYGGEIVEDPSGGFRYTAARLGSETNVGIRTHIEGYAGAYHSHPDLRHLGWSDGETFSGGPPDYKGDKGLADNTGEPVYVLSPSGRIRRYNPDPEAEKKGNGSETTIGRVEGYARN